MTIPSILLKDVPLKESELMVETWRCVGCGGDWWLVMKDCRCWAGDGGVLGSAVRSVLQ